MLFWSSLLISQNNNLINALKKFNFFYHFTSFSIKNIFTENRKGKRHRRLQKKRIKNRKKLPNDSKRAVLSALPLQHMNNVKLPAQMTVEAAFVIPFFIFFVAVFIELINFVNYDTKLNLAMYDAARNLSKISYENNDEEGDNLLSNNAISISLAHSEVALRMGSDSSKKIGVIGGLVGLIPVSSEMDEERVDYEINYLVKFPIGMPGITRLNCHERVSLRKWIGDKDEQTDSRPNADDEEDKLVYITETGSVYHTNRNCTHLNLSISSVNGAQIKNLRNSSGGKYYPCESCRPGKIIDGNGYFITDMGDRYHSNKNCNGLKRGVITVPFSKVSGMKLCDRCGKAS